MLANPTSPVSLGGDAVAVSIIPLAWANVLPSAAAGLTVVWLSLQIWTWVANKNWRVKVDIKTATVTTTTPKEPPLER